MAALPPFADETALGEWLGEDITDEKDVKRAQRCLRAASNRIRRYTKRSWVDENNKLVDPLPEDIEDVTLACAGRFYSNPEGETSWSRQIDDGMDGGSRKVDEAGLYLTASEMQTLDDLIADQSPLIGGLGVISTTRDEHASLDMLPYWFDDDDSPGFLNAKVSR
ncbi:hypothetical protein [Bifidobacterium scardovii]|uniref:Uncharacterized protein n=1 Tax=Bifidobacterium scardovii TaxID=158787 RepID=A0A087DGN4_9BIFI|nr:hypothetical protein [Bifidobacterium scardovii]DAE55476.1 MAG TPA: head to tail adaptor [Caudoviricetes sp.]KFI94684.1 hypothetical protein BSCA_0736 [Bifidobacterium scardovii]MDK6349822.1 hypothetical protein [Bifidobacterium scardovii]MDU8982526.1 hypothetical protein [Bifidobacterium scardovii]BAQ32086.1 hypothetical protein BBSC_2006 [Bifidobacterium scardovii JCM 12489 = DSM 13734]